MCSLPSERGPAMAAPSSRTPPTLPGHAFVSPPPRPCELHPSTRDPSPFTMGADVADDDGFLHPNRHMEQTLREHDEALGLIEKMDNFWFFDCVFGWRWLPTVRGCVQSQVQTKALSPFRSIEMMHAHSPGVKKTGNSFFPKVHFDPLPSAGVSQMVKVPTLAGEEMNRNFSFPSKESLETANRTPTIASSTEALKFLLKEETKSEEGGTRNLEQGEDEAEAATSLLEDCLEHTAWSPSKSDVLEPTKSISVSLVPNNTNLHLPRWRGRRKDRKNKSTRSEQFQHDETKALKELGFSCKEDKSIHIVDLIPGMKAEYGEGKNHQNQSYVASSQCKLYNSPDWWAAKPGSPLYNWKFPDPHQEGVDMKEQLKIWARAVAATVRDRS